MPFLENSNVRLALYWLPPIVGYLILGNVGFMLALLASTVFLIQYNLLALVHPRQLRIYRASNYKPMTDKIPSDFWTAWIFVQDNLAQKSINSCTKKRCDLCHKSYDGYPDTVYMYGGFKWSSRDIEHVMGDHVVNSSDESNYYLPERLFVDMVMAVYTEKHDTVSAA